MIFDHVLLSDIGERSTQPHDTVIQVVTPYEETVTLNRLSEGLYTVQVNCYLERRRVDFAEMSFEVQAGGGEPPNGFPWPDWPWPWW